MSVWQMGADSYHLARTNRELRDLAADLKDYGATTTEEANLDCDRWVVLQVGAWRITADWSNYDDVDEDDLCLRLVNVNDRASHYFRAEDYGSALAALTHFLKGQ